MSRLFFPGCDIYLVIHSIDGGMLRNEKTQTVLSQLAQISGLHVIASIDHINSSLGKDHLGLDNNLCIWGFCQFFHKLGCSSKEDCLRLKILFSGRR